MLAVGALNWPQIYIIAANGKSNTLVQVTKCDENGHPVSSAPPQTLAEHDKGATRVKYRVGEVFLLVAGGIVMLFNITAILYVLLTLSMLDAQ